MSPIELLKCKFLFLTSGDVDSIDLGGRVIIIFSDNIPDTVNVVSASYTLNNTVSDSIPLIKFIL